MILIVLETNPNPDPMAI